MNGKPDVCMILEGTYPYVSGGVSSWVHDLILHQPRLRFHLVCITPPGFDGVPCYPLPDNVVGMQSTQLGQIRSGRSIFKRIGHGDKAFFELLRPHIELFLAQKAGRKEFRDLVELFGSFRDKLDYKSLMNSKASWNLLVELYEKSMPEISFLDFFWSWRALVGGLFSTLMLDVPDAKCVHTICTGYAGLLMARAKAEKGTPCILTEHGIYTTERRFEIAFADWLTDQKAFSMSVNKSKANYELRDLWTDFFIQYGRICYESADVIISLFDDNRKIQIAGGAPPERCRVIPNGIDLKRFGSIVPVPTEKPTIAFIGRIVPIKDVKTFLRAVALLAKNIPDFKAYVIGGYEEDPEYYAECLEIIEEERLPEIIELTGKADVTRYLPKIDVVVLSSISEAQPLVILEAGAAGIPAVATNVGSCKEIIEGGAGDAFGPGGIVVPLSSPSAIADALTKLLLDDKFRDSCAKAMKRRVEKYYAAEDQHKAYRELYEEMIAKGQSWN